MRKTNCGIWMAAVTAVCLSTQSTIFAQAVNDGYVFSTLIDPSIPDVIPNGVSDGTVVGASPQGGFIFNGSTFENFIQGTPLGISGNTIVGVYSANNVNHGFIYNISTSTFTTLDNPAGSSTVLAGVSGNTIIGTFVLPNPNFFPKGSGVTESFIYNGSTFTPINDPLALPTEFSSGTTVTGISGNDIVGYYADALGYHGFLYNGSTYTTINDPVNPNDTYVTGVSGNTIVGYYSSGPSNSFDSFIYNGSTFTTIIEPLATGTPSAFQQITTQINGISEDGTIVGTFAGNGGSGGFIATPVVPEPASCALLAASGLLLLRRRSHAQIS